MSSCKFKIKFKFTVLGLAFLPLVTFASHKVYVIHGYGGFALQMEKINKGLMKNGYITENHTYLSLSEDLDSLGHDLYKKVKEENFDTVSFVTHSMGALVVRSMHQYLSPTEHFPYIFRIVMLAPPNKGTELANGLSNPALKYILGTNVEHMRTDSNSYANRLPVPTCETGIIAGIKGTRPWFNPFMKEDNDGVVSLSLTKLGNEKELVIINSTHALMTQQNKVIKLIIYFMKTGSFKNYKSK
ncbi:MAG: hypothetical protein PHT07_19545 [Paludibacter sp.]|nr:hypothetical protein [Paludibacter sp.]